MLTDEQCAEFISYMPKDLDDANVKIQQLLQHIADITPQTLVAYEIKSSASWQQNEGVYWHKGRAEQEVVLRKEEIRSTRKLGYRGRVTTARINVIRINGKWYKLNVTPFETIEGNVATAEKSNLNHARVIKKI